MWTPANLVCRVALRISTTPRAQMISTKVTSSQSKSRNEILRDIKPPSAISFQPSVNPSLSRRSCGQRQRLLRQVHRETASLQLLSMTVRIGFGPQTANFNFAIAANTLWLLDHLGWLLTLFINKGLNDLRRQSRRQFAMLATFEQHTHNDVRIAPRSESYKPSILVQRLVVLVFRASGERNNLCRSCLSRDIDSRNMRRWRGPFGQQNPAHGVGDEVPSVHVNRNVLNFGVMIDLDITWRQTCGICNMWHNHATVGCDG